MWKNDYLNELGGRDGLDDFEEEADAFAFACSA